MTISSDGRHNDVTDLESNYFRDCGALGKQTLELAASHAVVRFKTGRTSITQRGFILYFDGIYNIYLFVCLSVSMFGCKYIYPISAN